MSVSIEGKRILVTGAAGGIGSQVAMGLAQAGARLVVSDRWADATEIIAGSIAATGGEAVPLACNVAVEAEVAGLVEGAARGGRIDALVNLATFAAHEQLLTIPVEDFDTSVAVNLRGALLLSREVAKSMIADGRGGSLVHFSSVTSLFGAPGQAVYGMTKAGLAGLVKSMALEWAQFGVRVNGLSPTTTDTPLAAPWLDAEPGRREALARTVPLGRLAEPTDMMGALTLLVSDASNFITGQTLYVDGGVSVTHPLIKG